jgi:hypothetical protein
VIGAIVFDTVRAVAEDAPTTRHKDDIGASVLVQLSSNVVANVDRVCAIRKEHTGGQDVLRIHFRSKRTLTLRGVGDSPTAWERVAALTAISTKTGWVRLADGLLVNLDCVENVQYRDGSLSVWCVDGVAELVHDEKKANLAWTKLKGRAADSKAGLVLASPHLLLNLNNVDCIQGDSGGFRIYGPSATWPSPKDASEREAIWEKLQPLWTPGGQ